MDQRVIACIEGAVDSASVCAHAVWAAQRLGAPLELLHVLDRHLETAPAIDLSGAIGIDAQKALLDELSTLDEQRTRLALEQGRLLLESARQQAEQAGVAPQEVRQRHGALVDTVVELEPEARLFVLGPGRHHRESGSTGRLHLDHQIERVLRAVQRPVLVGARDFQPPERFMIAFDGSATARTLVERVAGSPLLQRLPAHLVMAAPSNADDAALAWAQTRLEKAGFVVKSALLPGEPEVVLSSYQREHAIGLLVMGAYGHSRIRQLIIGSTTTTLLRTSPVPVLVLR